MFNYHGCKIEDLGTAVVAGASGAGGRGGDAVVGGNVADIAVFVDNGIGRRLGVGRKGIGVARRKACLA